MNKKPKPVSKETGFLLRMNIKNRFIKRIIISLLVIILQAFFLCIIPIRSEAAPKKYVIAIDPGHGGKSTGAVQFGINEKDLDFAVSKALAEKLSEFENVEVVLTRDGDVDLSYEERVKKAYEKKADFMLSVHFNSTDNHLSTGSEIYVSKDEYLYKTVMPVAESIKESLEEIGVHSNGIFSREGEGEKDYYGLIRHSTGYRIPALIVEHLCMDREEYQYLITSEDSLKMLGERDAIAIARALKLKSEEYDFTKEPDIKYEKPSPLNMDSSTPDYAEITLEDYMQFSNTSCLATICVRANDPKGTLAGFRISEDCGKTYGKLQEFDYGGVGHFKIQIDQKKPKTLSVLVVNSENRSIASNFLDPMLEIELDPEFGPQKQEEITSEPVSDIPSEVPDVFDHEPRFDALKSIVVVFGILMGCVLCVLLYIMAKKDAKPKVSADTETADEKNEETKNEIG